MRRSAMATAGSRTLPEPTRSLMLLPHHDRARHHGAVDQAVVLIGAGDVERHPIGVAVAGEHRAGGKRGAPERLNAVRYVARAGPGPGDAPARGYRVHRGVDRAVVRALHEDVAHHHGDVAAGRRAAAGVAAGAATGAAAGAAAAVAAARTAATARRAGG